MREIEHRSSSHRSRRSSRSKSRERDRDRDRDYYSRRRRSNSRSRTSKAKKKKSKKKRYHRSSSSSSTSSKTSSRSRGSIKSRGSSNRRITHPPSSEDNSSSIQASKEINLLNDIPERSTIEKIEEDSFAAKPFYSTAESKKIPEKVIIDLRNDTISVERKVEDNQPEQSQIFHPNFLGDDMRKMEKWIKKLYNYRQKAFKE